jgi:hypothetical protein
MCGDLSGDIWGRMKGKEKPCQFIWQGQIDDCSSKAIVWLNQIQLCRPFDGRPAIIDVELTVNALGMCANSA